jgi:hypothetical protein
MASEIVNGFGILDEQSDLVPETSAQTVDHPPPAGKCVQSDIDVTSDLSLHVTSL